MIYKNTLMAAVMLCFWATSATLKGQSPGMLTFTAAGGQSAILSVAEDGRPTITITDENQSDFLTMALSGFGQSPTLSLSIDNEEGTTFELTDGDVSVIRLDLTRIPAGSLVQIRRDDQERLSASVMDPSGERVGVTVTISAAGSSTGLSISYDGLPEQNDPQSQEAAARITPLFPGLENENALGGSVTLTATGLSPESVLMVSLAYQQADVSGIDERDLRVFRFTNSTGRFDPVGTNNRGVGPPTATNGDYGVDVESNQVWAVVSRLGSFAAGVADTTLPQIIIPNDSTTTAGPSRSPSSICGTVGIIWIPLSMVTLVGIRQSKRCRW